MSEEQKIKPFRNAHFIIPMYRMPIVSLVTIFMPMWLVGWIGLAVFFQSSEFADRLATIATVMLAYLAFMPVVRDQLPPNPSITFIEILIYLLIGGTFLCLIESFLVRDLDCENLIDEHCEFDRPGNVALWIALFIQCASIVCVIVLVIRHYCFSLPKYNIIHGLEILFDPSEWKNKDCDHYFKEKAEKNDFHII